jgi:hypothetical protein
MGSSDNKVFHQWELGKESLTLAAPHLFFSPTPEGFSIAS